MSSRYEVISAWREVERETVVSGSWGEDRPDVLVIHETADIRDPRGGWTYREGAHRVRSFRGGRSFKRLRTFYGETAWMDAERMFSDIVAEVRYEC